MSMPFRNNCSPIWPSQEVKDAASPLASLPAGATFQY